MASLTGIRVLDLTDSRGELAGRLLADLGAEVVKVEAPQGVDSRQLGPFDADDKSLYWACYGLGKSSIVLDLTAGDGRGTLLDLAKGADILIESSDPGYMKSQQLDYETLAAVNPALIYIAITPFGQLGPKSGWAAGDFTLEAAGGRVAMQGDRDRPPIGIGFPQTYLHGGAQAAADVLIALNERQASGLGQFLDLSLQEVVWWTLMGTQGTPVCLNENPPHAGDDRALPPTGRAQYVPGVLPAKDGLVVVAVGANPLGKKGMVTFAIDEARDRGELESDLLGRDWNNWISMLRDNEISNDQLIAAMNHVRSYIKRRTKSELVTWALENDLRLGPLNTTYDLVSDAHLHARDFYIDVAGQRHLGPWVKMRRSPIEINRAAPSIGEHSIPEWERRPARVSTKARTGNAFEGLKVADFSWVAAGPTIAKALADHGATVVKVESETRLDLSRTLAPHIDGVAGVNRSYWAYLYATSKLSLQCNLRNDAGLQIARRMCDWADVVIESFSPGTMQRLGLDYEKLSQDHPDLVMLSTSMLGQTGPLRQYAGYGQQAAAFCGLQNITGWPDRDPCGVHGPYTDVIAPKFGIAALAAALYDRGRTGKGQFIDLAQTECSMYFLAPLIMDELCSGRTAVRLGAQSIYACPNGAYRTEGVERYIAISIETTQQWRALKSVLPLSKFDADKFDNIEERRAAREQIDEVLRQWCVDRDPWELEEFLATRGVPASVVQRPLDVFNDVQIEAREHKQILRHSETGDVVHYGFCTRFSAKKQMVRSAAPCLGEHNDLVLSEFLKLPDSEIDLLFKAGGIQ